MNNDWKKIEEEGEKKKHRNFVLKKRAYLVCCIYHENQLNNVLSLNDNIFVYTQNKSIDV